MKTTRQKSIAWWNTLGRTKQEELALDHYGSNLLLDDEIEQIWIKKFTHDVGWAETHFEVVTFINDNREVGNIKEVFEQVGTGGLWELSYEWTNKFQELNQDRNWDGEFFDDIEEFCELKNQE